MIFTVHVALRQLSHQRLLLASPGSASADVLCELAPMHPDLALAPGGELCGFSQVSFRILQYV